MGGTLTYAVAVIATVASSFLLWKAVGWWEHRRTLQRALRPDPVIERKREQSKELSRLAAQVTYGHESLLSESKLAPSRLA